MWIIQTWYVDMWIIQIWRTKCSCVYDFFSPTPQNTQPLQKGKAWFRWEYLPNPETYRTGSPPPTLKKAPMPNATHSPIWFYYIPSSYRNLIKNVASRTWFLSKQKKQSQTRFLSDYELDDFQMGEGAHVFAWLWTSTNWPRSPPKKAPTPKRYSVDDIHQQKIEVNSIPTPKALPWSYPLQQMLLYPVDALTYLIYTSASSWTPCGKIKCKNRDDTTLLRSIPYQNATDQRCKKKSLRRDAPPWF